MVVESLRVRILRPSTSVCWMFALGKMAHLFLIFNRDNSISLTGLLRSWNLEMQVKPWSSTQFVLVSDSFYYHMHSDKNSVTPIPLWLL